MSILRWYRRPAEGQGCSIPGCDVPATVVPAYLILCDDPRHLFLQQCGIRPFLCDQHRDEDQASWLFVSPTVWPCQYCTAWHRAVSRAYPGLEDSKKALLESNSVIGTCAHCHAAGVPVQLHHFAPRARFWDADAWPTAFLCLPCHRQWHGVMGWRPGQKPLIEAAP